MLKIDDRAMEGGTESLDGILYMQVAAGREGLEEGSASNCPLIKVGLLFYMN